MATFALGQVVVDNKTHLELTVGFQVRDGKLIIIIDEHESRTAAGLVIPKLGQRPLLT
jgi:hypothetical protein